MEVGGHSAAVALHTFPRLAAFTAGSLVEIFKGGDGELVSHHENRCFSLLPAPAGAGAGATCLPIVLPPDQTTSSVGTLPRLSATNIESIRPARPGTERRLQSAAEHLKVHRAQVVWSWRDSCRLPLLPPCCPPSAPSSIHMGCHVVGPSPRRNHPAPASPCLARGYFAMLPAALPPLP